MNKKVIKKKAASRQAPARSIHGNVKYNFHLLLKEGDFFMAEVEDRYNIYASLRNYNTKNNCNIKVKTRKTDEGLAVIRKEDQRE